MPLLLYQKPSSKQVFHFHMLKKGWLFDVMNCIEKIGKTGFTIDEIYSFEASLQKKHKNNKHIKAKIRQQLQILRDKNFLEFTEKNCFAFQKGSHLMLRKEPVLLGLIHRFFEEGGNK